jgi:FkbM family methyltransferase
MKKMYSWLPWNLAFMFEWLPRMSIQSVLRLRDYEVRSNRGGALEGKTLGLTLRSPLRGEILLREVGSDILTFNEVIGEQVYQDVLRHVPKCETIVDLGANIGLASLYFAASYPGCRIFAVEPNDSSYSLLNSNLGKLIAAGRCRTLNAAVWSSEASLAPDDSFEPNHYSAFATREVSVEADRNNGMIGLPMGRILADSGFEKIDLLKVDIEGAEIELFKGDLDWLRQVGAIAIEFHGNSREVCNFDEFTRRYGFRIIDHGGHTVIALKD